MSGNTIPKSNTRFDVLIGGRVHDLGEWECKEQMAYSTSMGKIADPTTRT